MRTVTLTETGEAAVLLELKDLRIGNILLYRGEYVHVTSLSMDIDDEYQETIGFCKLREHTNEIVDWNRAFCKDLKPIKLTAGLSEDAGSPLQKIGYEIKWTSTGRIDIRIGISYLTTLEHVHELQNLYHALTGEELELHLTPTPATR